MGAIVCVRVCDEGEHPLVGGTQEPSVQEWLDHNATSYRGDNTQRGKKNTEGLQISSKNLNQMTTIVLLLNNEVI